MLVQASAFGSWLHNLPHVFMSLFSNFLRVFCDLVYRYLINLIWVISWWKTGTCTNVYE